MIQYKIITILLHKGEKLIVELGIKVCYNL